MKIAAIELYHVSIPLNKPFWPSWIPGYPQTHNRFTLIRLMTDQGIDGWSAGSAMGKEREGLGDLIGGYLIGANPCDIDRIQSLLKQVGYLGFRNFWIEPACWDIMGKAQGKPVYELLGGAAKPIPAYCSTGEVLLPAQRIEKLAEVRRHGFALAKIRLRGTTLTDDIHDLQAIRKGVGDGMRLAVDVNQGWLVSIVDRIPAWDLARAREFARACADNDIAWLEEPLDSRDYDGLAALKKSSPVPIAGAELNYGWDELKIMLEKDCWHIYQSDATFAGGIAQVKQLIDACGRLGRDYSPHTWTNGIGFYINWNLRLSASFADLPIEYPFDGSWQPEVREGIIAPIRLDANAMLQPFTRPGLGFEIDRRLLRKYGKRFFSITERGLAFKVLREKGIKATLELRKRKSA
jgi:L-alanine-DL-glutamate epimerase-like enolase superfamily enzyme